MNRAKYGYVCEEYDIEGVCQKCEKMSNTWKKMEEVNIKQAEICVGWAWDMFNEFFATHTSIPLA